MLPPSSKARINRNAPTTDQFPYWLPYQKFRKGNVPKSIHIPREYWTTLPKSIWLQNCPFMWECYKWVSELISAVIKGKDEGLYTVALFLDLSKAFDFLDHQMILTKLEKYGIRGVALDWFRSYLNNRQTRVKCTSASTGKVEYSEYKPVKYGNTPPPEIMSWATSLPYFY